MKRYLLALLAFVGPLTPAIASPGTASLPSYTAVVRISSVPASPARILAFQNTSTNQDILVDRIEIANSSTMTVTSGVMAFWVYTSTSLTHSALTSVQTFGYNAALVAQPAAITMSTAPINVQFEGDTGILTAAQQNALSGTASPVIRPMAVNASNTATASLSDAWAAEQLDWTHPIILPMKTQRALVFEKRQLADSDWSAGAVTIRIHYTVR